MRSQQYRTYSFESPNPLEDSPEEWPVPGPDPLVSAANVILNSGEESAGVRQICRAYCALEKEYRAYKMWAEQQMWDREQVAKFLRDKYGVREGQGEAPEEPEKLEEEGD